MQSKETVGIINAYAMQHGIALGCFGIATLAVYKWSFSVPFFSTMFGVMLLATPFFAAFLTMKFRADSVEATEPFGFLSGFLHALFTGFYASIWIALATFVYLQYFDHGSIFAAYADSLHSPEMQLYMKQSGLDAQINEMMNGKGVNGLVEAIQSVGAATYAALSLYFALIFGPFISIIIGLVCRRK